MTFQRILLGDRTIRGNIDVVGSANALGFSIKGIPLQYFPTIAQPPLSPLAMTQGQEVVVAHPFVLNEMIFVNAMEEVVGQAGLSNISADFDLADELNYIQEDSLNGTDFTASGTITLKETPADTGDLTTGKVYSASSQLNPASNAFDDNNLTTWKSGAGLVSNQWAGVDLGSPIAVNKVSIANGSGGVNADASIATFKVQGSNDDFLTAPGFETVVLTKANNTVSETFLFTNINAYRYWRIAALTSYADGTGGTGIGASEIEMARTYIAHPANQPYYVTTGDLSHFDIPLNLVDKINTVTIDHSVPAGTSVKTFVSFDNRATWKYFNATTLVWNTAPGGLDDLQTLGMLPSDAETALTGYIPQVGDSAIDFAFDLMTTDNTIAPSIDLVTIRFDSRSSFEYRTVSKYGSTGDYGMKRLSATRTVFKKQSAGSSRVFLNVSVYVPLNLL